MKYKIHTPYLFRKEKHSFSKNINDKYINKDYSGPKLLDKYYECIIPKGTILIIDSLVSLVDSSIVLATTEDEELQVDMPLEDLKFISRKLEE